MSEDVTVAEIIRSSAAAGDVVALKREVAGSVSDEELALRRERLAVEELVEQAVRLEVYGGKGVREVARELGVSEYRLRRWRKDHADLWAQAYEQLAEEMERQRDFARRRVEWRLSQCADQVADELERLAFNGSSDGVRLKAIELALRVLGGGRGGGGGRKSDPGVAPVLAQLKAIGKDVKINIGNNAGGEDDG